LIGEGLLCLLDGLDFVILLVVIVRKEERLGEEVREERLGEERLGEERLGEERLGEEGDTLRLELI
jgi:hypothetical protein